MQKTPALTVKIAGLQMKNPFILASGILDTYAETMLRVAEDAGAVVTKSIGMEERKGYENPVIFEFEHGVLNAMGLPNPGIERFGEEMKKLRGCRAPVIGSIFGKNEKEFAHLAERMEEYGAAAVELNLSCPHASGYGMEVGRDPALVKAIVRAVKEAVQIPVFVKLTPNVSDITVLGMAAEEAGADAVVAINTVRGLRIDLEFKRSVLTAGIGGYSGPGILPIGLRCVFELKKVLRVPIVGCGGITTWENVIEYLMAGASAVEIGTALRNDVRLFKNLGRGVKQYMKRKGYERVEEVVALAHQNR
ncbi:MAG: dihydroorotate dehydrogenase [Thermoplasmata archaeon]|nr:dihydroorotate dehydrogenase [Thermoplasmata archaeon]